MEVGLPLTQISQLSMSAGAKAGWVALGLIFLYILWLLRYRSRNGEK